MRIFLTILLIGCCSANTFAAKSGKPSSAAAKPGADSFIDRKVDEEHKAAAGTTKWDAMDIGPFFSSGFGGKHPAYKSLSIKLDGTNAAAAFDMELLRMTVAWTGGFVKLPVLRGGLEGFPEPAGTPLFTTPATPGWARNGSFKDPRPTFRRFDYGMNDKKLVPFPMELVYGNLPKDWAKWKGFYAHGDRVILSYSVGKREVLDMPSFAEINKVPVFSRTFEIDGAAEAMELLVCEAWPLTRVSLGDNFIAAINEDSAQPTFTAVKVHGLYGADFDIKQGSIILKVPRSYRLQQFKVMISSGPLADLEKCQLAMASDPAVARVGTLCQGGPKLWGEPLVTKGKLGSGDDAYVVDTLTQPEENPWKSWIRASGFDFFSDGRAAVCSVSGDVWIVGGIDDKLEKLTWKRFATGLFQPLGLKIVDDKIYITGRDQITRLHDSNNDGEADFYENFNNDVSITPHYHEFCLNLETDSRGNFYFCKGSNLREAGIPHHGTLLKVSPDGEKLEVICNGLRAPNGMGIGPDDEISVADNEGRWIPSSRVSLVRPGGFYGNVFTGFTSQPRTEQDLPLFWIPHNNNIDNSSGGQVWVTSDRWGRMAGKMLHTSYGTCSLFAVLQQNVEGVLQAAAVKFPLKFESGIMRGRTSPFDGQLYLCGLSVWQSNAAKEGAFQRVRYTGKTVHMPTDFQVKSNGLAITFACPLDEATAADPENYSVEVWNYKWTKEYGSKEYSVKKPDEDKHDPIAIKSARLSSDKKTVTLELAEIFPVMQMKIQYNINAADGATMKQEIFNSIFKVPGVMTVGSR